MNKQILIVDDDKDVTDMLMDAFTLKGYKVICAYNGAEALAALTPEIQVMFLDLKLPGGISGLDLCKQIRKDHPAACIYAMTGHSSLFELADYRKAGFDDYFTKPINLPMFYMAAEQAFARVAPENKSR